MSQDSGITDTTPEAQKILHVSLKKMSFPQKLALIKQLNTDVTAIAIAGIRREHPQYSQREINYELLRRRYGNTLADIAFGSTPS